LLFKTSTGGECEQSNWLLGTPSDS
jgi:hypothetical protein